MRSSGSIDNSSDFSDSSDLMESCTNDSGEREGQDRWGRTLLCSSDPLAIPSSIPGVVHNDSNDRTDYTENQALEKEFQVVT